MATNQNQLLIIPIASLGNASPMTLTLTSNSYPNCVNYVQQINRDGGLFVDDGSWISSFAIGRIIIQ